ncbi:MAG: hypothetical protein QXD77_03525 [Candidatus Aenigmatarchaeota archaeon]
MVSSVRSHDLIVWWEDPRWTWAETAFDRTPWPVAVAVTGTADLWTVSGDFSFDSTKCADLDPACTFRIDRLWQFTLRRDPVKTRRFDFDFNFNTLAGGYGAIDFRCSLDALVFTPDMNYEYYDFFGGRLRTSRMFYLPPRDGALVEDTCVIRLTASGQWGCYFSGGFSLASLLT